MSTSQCTVELANPPTDMSSNQPSNHQDWRNGQYGQNDTFVRDEFLKPENGGENILNQVSRQ